MKVLVAYASKYGATKGIAERIGEGLKRRGLEVDVSECKDSRDESGYDAYVVGSAAYAFNWRKDARKFVTRNAEVLAEAERLGDPRAVEAAHLVGVQALVLRLHGEVRDGLAEVVARPRTGRALGVDGLGDVHDEHGGRVGPRLVEAHERVMDARERIGAAPGDDEAPRLGVVRRRRPTRCLEDRADDRGVDHGGRVVGARAPALDELVLVGE